MSNETHLYISETVEPFLLPPINEYIPKNLEMKSLCVIDPKKDKSLV